MSMPRAVRHINETRALSVILKRRSLSRADLARELGITRATAGSIVQSLTEAGYIEDDQGNNDRQKRTGRPGTLVSLRSDHAIFLGAGIGVEHVVLVAIDMKADPIARQFVEADVPRLGFAELAAMVSEAARGLASELRVPEAIQGLNVAVPGPVNFDGVVLRAPLLGWRDVPLKKYLEERLTEIPISNLDNDANAFAIADMHLCGREDKLDAVYLFIDEGVGGCVVSDGTILHGHDGFAGELGHIIVGDAGFAPQTRVKGSLESFIGRSALLSRHRFYGGRVESVGAFIERLRAQEPAARLALDDWAHFLGRGVATLVSAFNPERVILGGGVAAVFPFAREALQASIREHLLEGTPETEIELSPLGIDAPAYGAALIQHRQFFAMDSELLFGISPA